MRKHAICDISGPGIEAATYLYPFLLSSPETMTEMALRFGYTSHNNLSAVKWGSARVPIKNALKIASFFASRGLDEKKYLSLVLKQWITPEDLCGLQEKRLIHLRE